MCELGVLLKFSGAGSGLQRWPLRTGSSRAVDSGFIEQFTNMRL